VTSDRIAANIESWRVVEAFVESMPESAHWTPWKTLARRIIGESVKFGLNRYFRAGQSMSDLVFSTLDHHGLQREPRVIVKLRPENDVHLAYWAARLYFSIPMLEYTLPFDLAFPTFVRFLNQLWTATMPEAVPEDVRRPLTILHVPVLTEQDRSDT
jgi:hypothetical protein